MFVSKINAVFIISFVDNTFDSVFMVGMIKAKFIRGYELKFDCFVELIF